MTSSPTPDRVTPLKCWLGASISGGLAALLYLLTHAIASTLAAKPLPSSNATALNIAVAVRTLVVGVATLATVVLAIAAIGLLILGIQTALHPNNVQNGNREEEGKKG